MQTIAEHLTGLVEKAAAAAGHAEARVDPCVATRDPSHGDYQSNFAFRLGKQQGVNPRELASALVAHLPSDPAVARTEVAGPGFINFHLADEWMAEQLKARATHPDFGPPEAAGGRTVVIDYSSPNIAKRMHIGHLRSTIIGNALHRMHRWVGWEVVADNHVGDWGTPFGLLIVAWNRWRDDAAYAADPVGELQRLYQRASELKKDDPELLAEARAETVKLQAKDPVNLALWQQFVDVSMQEFNGLYERLGVEFDAVMGESAYADELAELVDDLLEQGIAEESEGAVVVPFDGSDGKGLGKNPLLVRKADGAALYGTTDLATVRHRVRVWHADRIVYLTDLRQQLHFRQVFAACRKMGFTEVELEHVWFGVLTIEGAVASTRAGTVINLTDLLDTAARKAFEIVTAKAPELPEEERRDIAEAVGVGAIKYFDLSQNPQSNIDFSWDKALSLDAGSSVYLQYAFARMSSILRKGGVADAPPDVLPSTDHPAERALVTLANRTPEVVITAVEAYRPNLLAEHLEALATAVGPFYEHCPVLKEGVPDELRDRRLALVFSVARALEAGLGLLGIRTIPRM